MKNGKMPTIVRPRIGIAKDRVFRMKLYLAL